MNERIELSLERIKEIRSEKGLMEYQPFFTSLAEFLVNALEYDAHYEKNIAELHA